MTPTELRSLDVVMVPISKVLESMPGKPCEDCGGHERRRVLCFHCGMYVCRWCWNHKHQCQPGHSKQECRDWARYKRLGMDWIKRLRARRATITA